MSLSFVILGKGTYLADVFPQGLIERCGEEDYGGKASCPRNELIEERPRTHIGHAVKCLGPPLVLRQAEPGDPVGPVPELHDLLGHCHAPHQVLRPHAVGQRGVAE